MGTDRVTNVQPACLCPGCAAWWERCGDVTERVRATLACWNDEERAAALAILAQAPGLGEPWSDDDRAALAATVARAKAAMADAERPTAPFDGDEQDELDAARSELCRLTHHQRGDGCSIPGCPRYLPAVQRDGTRSVNLGPSLGQPWAEPSPVRVPVVATCGGAPIGSAEIRGRRGTVTIEIGVPEVDGRPVEIIAGPMSLGTAPR